MRHVVVLLCLLTGCALALAQAAAEKRQLLSRHVTVARYAGTHQQTCRGLTTLCPDNCGDSGDYATFTILAYLVYEKPGEYGDPKAESFVFQLQDNKKNAKAPPAIAEVVGTLKAGDDVRLDWDHEYVTRTEGGGSASFPQRPIRRLQKITKEEANKLIQQAQAK